MTSDIIFAQSPDIRSGFPAMILAKIFNKPLVIDYVDIKDTYTPKFIYDMVLRISTNFPTVLLGYTTMKLQNVINAVKELIDKFPEDHIKCLETGTIRSYTEKQESTRHIGETLGKRGSLLSIDINEHSIKVSKDICSHLNNIEWTLSDSIDYLSSYNDDLLHFIFLDSVNDAEHIYQEFKYAINLVHDHGIIIIDDAGVSLDGQIPDPTHPGTKKGHTVFNHLRSQDLPFKLLQTIQGTQLRLDVTPEIKRILETTLD